MNKIRSLNKTLNRAKELYNSENGKIGIRATLIGATIGSLINLFLFGPAIALTVILIFLVLSFTILLCIFLIETTGPKD